MIIYYITLLLSFFIIFFIVRIKRFVFHNLAENSVALVNTLLSNVEEDTKIQDIQTKTNKLVVSLFKMFFIVFLAIIIGSIPIVIYCLVINETFNNLDFSSFYSILFISIGATVAFIIPFKKDENIAYSELSQLLHRMALNNYNIGNKLFKRETRRIKKRNLERKQQFVIISGLARAGTTSLMNDLVRIDDFVSLNYGNMPFIMCPNYWAKIYKPKQQKLKERSHKDGIMIGLNSNEALEEYFFKVKANDSYINDLYLSEYEISQNDYSDYQDYQSIIMLDNNKIYLAKNNNFILRYKSARSYNDDFVMVILYRDPLTHAASLLEKHKEYKKLQKEDPFVLEYMDWLGHHEFGENQKPFKFHNSKTIISKDKDSLNYWLEIWINYYSYILSLSHENTIIINYDLYCENPKRVINSIIKKINLQIDLPDYDSFKNERNTTEDYSTELYDTCQKIYEELNKIQRSFY